MIIINNSCKYKNATRVNSLLLFFTAFLIAKTIVIHIKRLEHLISIYYYLRTRKHCTPHCIYNIN